MKRILSFAVMLIAVSIPALSQTTTSQPGQGGAAEQAVTARVREFLAALRKGEEATLAPFYADDYSVTVANGTAQTKAQRLEWVKANAARMRALDYQDLKVQVYGDTAVVTGHATGSAEGAAPINSRFIQVWVKQGGTWRMVAGQITDIAPPPAEKKP